MTFFTVRCLIILLTPKEIFVPGRFFNRYPYFASLICPSLGNSLNSAQFSRQIQAVTDCPPVRGPDIGQFSALFRNRVPVQYSGTFRAGPGRAPAW